MSLFDYETVIVPDFENDKIKDVIPVADFIKSRLAQYNLSLLTAQDAIERDELLASMIMCNASLALLSIAYIAETDTLIAAAKDLMRDPRQ